MNNIATKDKVYMPAGIGGLMRYQEEGEQLIKVKPKQVVWIVVGIVAIELLLKFLF